MKIAISIPDDVFQEVESYVAEQKCSRSEVFARAVAQFFEKSKNAKLLDAINEVYSTPESAEDKAVQQTTKKHFAKTVLSKEPPY
jgi:metal-responsive CopG/Arc/MetJ family transcriptional regulator